MLHRLYNGIIALSSTRYALWVLGAVAFAESSFFPIPPDIVLVPMVLAEPSKARLYAAWCTIASVLGGLVGYAIGSLLWDTLGAWLISAYGYGHSFEAFREAYAHWGAWIILIKGMTPIPYKLVTIASGFAGYDIWAFIGLSLITRGARFFIEAELLRYFGEPIRGFVEKRLTLVTTGFLAVTVLGVLIAKYAF
jgi:membrane protein YqaA with SNARE-associated domain